MRLSQHVVALSIIALVSGCSQDPPSRQKASTTSRPSTAANEKTEQKPTTRATKKVASAKPKARVADVAMPSGVGLDLPTGNPLGSDVSNFNPVKLDQNSTFGRPAIGR
jgi:hypothetical protein